MDGNGRWAEKQGLERFKGHIAGVKSVRQAIETCLQNGVEYLTIYTFSTENWGRPQQEIDALMELFCQSVVSNLDDLMGKGVRVKTIGSKEELGSAVKEHLSFIENKTANLDKLTLVIALNYSSKSELVRMTKKIAQECLDAELEPKDIDENCIAQRLDTESFPNPDLLIRTGGEYRLSNFLLWQCAYSELYFTPVLWPDFNQSEFEKALEEYKRRERRFGLIIK